jgi:hypothetical protein
MPELRHPIPRLRAGHLIKSCCPPPSSTATSHLELTGTRPSNARLIPAFLPTRESIVCPRAPPVATHRLLIAPPAPSATREYPGDSRHPSFGSAFRMEPGPNPSSPRGSPGEATLRTLLDRCSSGQVVSAILSCAPVIEPYTTTTSTPTDLTTNQKVFTRIP